MLIYSITSGYTKIEPLVMSFMRLMLLIKIFKILVLDWTSDSGVFFSS